MYLTLVLSSIVCLSQTQSAPAQSPGIFQVKHGDLSATFRDNSESPPTLSGIDSLFNIKAAPDFDAYDPDSRGASAGMNFEHIISGHNGPNNAFTPRHGRFTMQGLPDGRGVQLIRRAADDPWGVDSTLTYWLVAPHYVDVDFRCRPRDAARFGQRGYAIFFFCNYMNDVADPALHFRGVAGPGQPETWISADAPPGHPHFNHGGTYHFRDASALEYDADLGFNLNSWTYDYPRFTLPFYYGRAARGMALILMFDRAWSERDEIRFSLFKFKLDRFPRPAWDFQYVIHKVEQDREYGYRARLAWKRFVSEEDCFSEYRNWAGSLATQPDRTSTQAKP